MAQEIIERLESVWRSTGVAIPENVEIHMAPRAWNLLDQSFSEYLIKTDERLQKSFCGIPVTIDDNILGCEFVIMGRK